MHTRVWRLGAAEAPCAVRPCGKCGAEAQFRSTGAFRVNAQKKRLDVWLIYRCATCGAVWNCTVLSRVNPSAVSPEDLAGYTDNDACLAHRCALDASMLKRNGARRGKVALSVIGDDIDRSEDWLVEIEGGELEGVRVAEVLRLKLGISRSRLARLVEAGRIASVDGSDVVSMKLKGSCAVVVLAEQN